MIGVVQEQHRDRPTLFAQWQEIKWPILQDPINLFETRAVPRLVAIDEHGIIRSTRPRLRSFEQQFINKKFDDDASNQSQPLNKSVDPSKLGKLPAKATPKEWLTSALSKLNIRVALEATPMAIKGSEMNNPNS